MEPPAPLIELAIPMMYAPSNSTNTTKPPSWLDQAKDENQRYFGVQLVVSLTFGLSAFIAFCVLRPRWTQLYNARKKQSQSAARLPELPKSFLGWIPVLYNISREEVLASAGLDAFAFLSFFRYAIKYLSVTLFFALTIILPVNYQNTGECIVPGWCPTNGTNGTTDSTASIWHLPTDYENFKDGKDKKPEDSFQPYGSYLWMYVVFAWFFTAIALYLLVVETKSIIHTRQAYLGTQNTITDRTIRLSGIPHNLRSEEKLRAFVEELGIGKVDSVILCKNWKRLDQMIEDRMCALRKLEEHYATYIGHSQLKRSERKPYRHALPNGPEEDHETTALLSRDELERSRVSSATRKRPLHTIWYGPLRLRPKKIDAIDYFEEKVRRYDEQIAELRQQDFSTTPLAFVTMESTAACQMAIQAKLDPVPGQLMAAPAPPPADVVWRNTYLSRNHRMARSWSIMLVVGFLTIFWAVLLVPPATLISDAVTDKFFPGLKGKDAAVKHPIANPLVKTTLPTLYFTLLSVGVPYLYDWLSNQQGMTSQSDIELSVVSKNFFFNFFNLFVVFTIFSSVTQFYDFYKKLQDVVRDTSLVAFLVAAAMSKIWRFYANLIVLQGLGLLPFRLLEFGSVALYPFYLLSAKTPRDHADLAKAPVFQYGFYLPQSMLIFVICIVYSILPTAWLIILFGLIYFCIAHFIYKYQLLYAMEHAQHSTGRIWPMICNRIFLGLIIFHIAMTGILAARQALTQAVFMAPLIIATVWFTVYFQRTYFPLMYFIALRSIDRRWQIPLPEPSQSPWDLATDRGRTVDTDPDTGLRYMNPNLTQPLEKLWVRKPVHNDHDNRRDQPV
ncbi:hypothetical protein OHC33_009768 [Knufia fluminis]|uniref:DUF221-domain-containing protein n=1 Tax=Knufia fluminis TaxID=191047 RepID=A0AAN8EF27_9EURO|nr:hypothetical protein OHC33_009768 [Knufia fluminis]